MKVTVVGFTHAKTERTIANVEAAVKAHQGLVHVQCISDVRQMYELGVRQSPAVLVNNKLKISGHIPSVYEVQTWIAEGMEEGVGV